MGKASKRRKKQSLPTSTASRKVQTAKKLHQAQSDQLKLLQKVQNGIEALRDGSRPITTVLNELDVVAKAQSILLNESQNTAGALNPTPGLNAALKSIAVEQRRKEAAENGTLLQAKISSGCSPLAQQSPSDSDRHHKEDPAFKYYNKQENETIVTQEMLWRDLLEDPKVKKKNKKGYRPLDNRDSLPFVVKVMSPDPYTPVSEKKREAQRNTERERKKRKTPKQTNLMGGIAASIYAEDNDGSLQKILGEFSLDKNTNCGDLLEVGDKEYEVQKARCQYKYAGGKRFIMVRKILEVKEVVRVAEENFLKRQLSKSDSLSDEPPPLE